MLLLEGVDPERWYSVCETAGILGWGVDQVRRWVYRGLLKAFIAPCKGSRRTRIYRCVRIQGREIIRFVQNHLNKN